MRTLILAAAAVLAASPRARADEGMWLYNGLPLEALKKKYGFVPTKAWLENLQKSSVRVQSGGSASFISRDGLLITNHHVGSDALKAMNTREENFLRKGFHAKTRDQEHKCPGIELNVLMQIIDVTKRVNAAVPDGSKAEDAAARRQAEINKIEKEAAEKHKLKPQVVTLFQGGAYHLYLYKRYNDVRLVFAPEKAIAFFGGDPDNFEFPRYDLDICIFRVYEDNKPIKCDHFLTFARKSVKENDLVFVSGHPGRTNRMNTVADLEYLRDVGFPYLMQRLNRMEVLLNTFSGRSAENSEHAEELLFSIQNSRKARIGGLAALLDPALMKQKKEEEKKLKAAATAEQKKAWEKIAEIQKLRPKLLKRYVMLEGAGGFWTDYFGIARTLVRAAEERAKDNKDRLPEFSEARLPSLTQQLFDPEEIHNEFEIAKLAASLTWLASDLGAKDPVVQKALAGMSPLERARELVRGTKLKDVKERERIYKGGKDAIADSKDPMVLLAKLVDVESRKARKEMETKVDEPLKQAYADVASVLKAKFASGGGATYPDATFTLRLAPGVVKGYKEGGKDVPYTTTFKGLYERSKEFKNREPFELPESWVKAKDKLDLSTPFNFVSTNDIIGGNSGSPMVNRKGEFVGIIFDGNIQSLRLDFAFDEVEARAVSVDAQAILAALKTVYKADDLVREIQGGK